MATYKTKGIVLKRKDVGEADKIITVFSDRYGKIIARAKGVRKILSKNGGSIELFILADFVFAEGKNFDILVGASIINSFKNIRNNLKKTAIAYYFVELVDKLTSEKEGSNKIFGLLLESFSFLDSKKEKLLIYPYFELNLLSYLGYFPQLEKCVHCHKEINSEINYFSNHLGGIVCPNCQNFKNPHKISQNALKTLRVILKYDFGFLNKIKINEEIQKEVKFIVENFLKHVAEKEFKSPKFIASVSEQKGSLE